jgi:hypothetical protein
MREKEERKRTRKLRKSGIGGKFLETHLKNFRIFRPSASSAF